MPSQKNEKKKKITQKIISLWGSTRWLHAHNIKYKQDQKLIIKTTTSGQRQHQLKDMSSKRRTVTSGKNVLPNTYIPVLSKKVLTNFLSRLPKLSLIELVSLWPKLANTQPHLDKENHRGNQKEYNALVSKASQQMKVSQSRWPKRRIIDEILFEYWNKGLNLLQMSQVDCQLIVDRPNAFHWILSTVRDGNDKEVSILLNPKNFLHSLTKDLSSLFINNIYVCRHPMFPLIIIRIQVFDLQPTIALQSSTKPHISSHKPYFLAIPLNSPHIIHTPGDDMITNIVMQTVERSLPQNPMNLLRLITDDKQKPIRSLESMHILKGSSRFANSLGVWSSYADGVADILPLDKIEGHATLREIEQQKQLENETSEEAAMTHLKELANLRFKGSKSGKMKSSKLYDDNKTTKQRRSKRIMHLTNEIDGESSDEESTEKSEFTSIAPIQYAEFLIKEPFAVKDQSTNEFQQSEDENETHSFIKLKLTGTDVFAGLHELSVLTTNEHEKILDPTTIPGWLTGEDGRSNGIVKNGNFIPTD